MGYAYSPLQVVYACVSVQGYVLIYKELFTFAWVGTYTCLLCALIHAHGCLCMVVCTG